MKNVWIIVLMLASTVSFSQRAATLVESNEKAKLTPEERVQKNVNRLSEELGLNDIQKEKIYALQMEKAVAFKANQQNRKAEMDKKREAMRVETEKYDTQMKEILTADQYTKWKENRKKNLKDRKGQRGKKGFKNKN